TSGPQPTINFQPRPSKGRSLCTPVLDYSLDSYQLICNMQQQQKLKPTCRISYTRDFLIALANCPEARKKPEFLPEHPIVLTEAVSCVLVSYFIVVSSLLSK
uniref:Uncharacterized protein n=1 Tax=Sparus aurata TaxID=8175 RepID=A0A671WUV8_SPAAU